MGLMPAHWWLPTSSIRNQEVGTNKSYIPLDVIWMRMSIMNKRPDQIGLTKALLILA